MKSPCATSIYREGAKLGIMLVFEDHYSAISAADEIRDCAGQNYSIRIDLRNMEVEGDDNLLTMEPEVLAITQGPPLPPPYPAPSKAVEHGFVALVWTILVGLYCLACK